jgi:hypothetical protein
VEKLEKTILKVVELDMREGDEVEELKRNALRAERVAI